jgi:hypothetical protein
MWWWAGISGTDPARSSVAAIEFGFQIAGFSRDRSGCGVLL